MDNTNNSNNTQGKNADNCASNKADNCASNNARDYIPSTTSKTNQSKENPDTRERRDGPGGN